jgi:hypothetical protein
MGVRSIFFESLADNSTAVFRCVCKVRLVRECVSFNHLKTKRNLLYIKTVRTAQ